jgi:hypothetical protein
VPGNSQLPRIDEHPIDIAAAPAEVWEQLLRVSEGSTRGAAAARYARLVGCEDTEAVGPRPLAAGSAFPGFHVEVAEPGRELALAGSHRFSDYRLVFRLDDLGERGTRLRAETRAAFPGPLGQLYKTAVIRSRGHVLVVNRMLGAVRRRAERS